MTNHYLVINDKLLEANIEKDSDLRVKAFSLNCSDCKLANVCEFSWSFKVKVELVCTSVIKESATCRRIAVALIALHDTTSKTGRDVDCYLIHLNVKAEKCVPIRKCSVQKKVIEEACMTKKTPTSTSNLIILDGPSVLLVKKSHLLFYWCAEGTTLSHVKFAFGENCSSKHCGSREILSKTLDCHCHFMSKIIFIQTNLTNTCTSCSKSDGQYLTVLEIKDGNFMKLDPTLFIPEEFYDSLNSIHVSDMKVKKSSVISSEIFASTNNGFILSLRNGHLVNCVSLHENITAPVCTVDIQIKCIESEDKQYVIGRKDKTFTVLDQHLKVQKEYPDMQLFLSGDFIGNGTVQCLFVKSHDVISSEWIFDDFNQLCITSGDKSTSTSSSLDTDDNTYTATRALQQRLQRERLLHQQQEQSLHKKKEFLRNTVQNQLQPTAACGTTDIKPQVDLVPLIEGHIEEVKDTKTTSGGPECVVNVCGVWQKTLGNKWCMGVEFQWKSKRSAEVWLQAIPNKNAGSPLVIQSASIICPSECSDESQSNHNLRLPKEQKRQKTDRSTLLVTDDIFLSDVRTEPVEYTVTCVTDIPQFFQSSISVCLMLKWRFIHGEGSDLKENQKVVNGMLSDFSGGKVFTKNCGEMTLDSGDVITGQHEISIKAKSDSSDCDMDDFKDVSRSKLAWRAIQTCTELLVHSSAGVLARIDELLVQRCQFVYCCRFQCYITPITTLNNVQLELPPSNTDASREMRAYTGSERDLFLLLHHLYKCLPDNVVILPDGKNRNLLQDILPSIQQETSLYADCIRKLLEDHEKKMAAVSRDGKGDEINQTADVKRIGESFKRKRDEFIQKEKETVDVSAVEGFLAELSLLKHKTDSMIASENS